MIMVCGADAVTDPIQEEEPDLSTYNPYHIEHSWECGVGKIYDAELIWQEKDKDYFDKEYRLKVTGVGNRVFDQAIIQHCVELGNLYDPENVSMFTEKYLMCDPAFYGSNFGIVVNELVDGNIRVLYAEEFHRPSTQAMIDKILELRVKYRNIKNILIDAAVSEFIVDIKEYFDNTGCEYPHNYNEKIKEWEKEGRTPWNQGMFILPVPFNKRVQYTQRLKKAMLNENYWINRRFDKLTTCFDTAVARPEASDIHDVDKEHLEFSDVFDAQLALFHRLKPI